MTNDYRQPIARACDCAGCRARAARDFWRIIDASYAASDEQAAEDRARTPSTLAERIGAYSIRGEEDGA